MGAMIPFIGGLCLLACGVASADDWPQWRGALRDGVVREKGLRTEFPTNGLPVIWRVPISAGYSGPAVVGNRLFVMDRPSAKPLERKRGEKSMPTIEGTERVLCLDARSARTNWEHSYECAYRVDYPAGPRTTPLVDAEKVYTLGTMGDLRCVDAASGKPSWSKNFLADFKLQDPPVWGWAAHPLLAGTNVICLVGGEGSGVVAFDKNTGKESWRALTSKEIGYAPPVLATINGKKQLVVWLTDVLAGLDPNTGEMYWSFSYPPEGKAQRPEVTVSPPAIKDDLIFISTFYHGALLLKISNSVPVVVWNRKSTSKSEFNDGLHTVMSTLLFSDDSIFGVCGFGELRCVDVRTGDRLWETYEATGGKKGLFANAFLMPHENMFYIWNDQGELISARLTRKGYEQISRARLLEPTEHARGRTIVWSHPAFANGRIYVRNQQELLCVSLADPG
jgi:outer membrane protein assembly factor BamB